MSDLKAQIAAGYAKAGVDIVWTGGDLGSEIAMLMSPELWRKHLKSCVRKIVKSAKEANADVLVAFHSDGYIEPIIPDLIEVGIVQLIPQEFQNPYKNIRNHCILNSSAIEAMPAVWYRD